MPASVDRVKAWLRKSSPESSSQPADRPRKRHGEADRSRNSSPKRQRVDADDVLPTQSASQAGSISIVDLSDRTISNTPQGSERSPSPTSHLTELRTVTPSISLSPLNRVKKPPPADVTTRISSLRSCLGRREGLETGYIPAGLRRAIEADALFAPSLAIDPIDPEVYDHDDTRPISHPVLVDTLDRVKNIFQDACHCTEFERDENAWCYRVVWPLIELSMKLYGNDKFKLECVQSQNIQPRYLPTMPEPTLASPNRRVALMRKTDFCFSYSCFDPRFAELYKQLAAVKAPVVSHTSDNCTQRLALFSGIEVKSENGNLKEAELQVMIWMAASLRKKMELAHLAFPISDLPPIPGDVVDNATTSADMVVHNIRPLNLVEPALTIIGNEHKVYYAYPSSAEGDVTVLGPDERFAHLTTRSVQGIFKLVRFYGRILEWGFGEQVNTSMERGFWGAFLGPVLETLANGG